MSEDKTYLASCGANISKAHFMRNTSKVILTRFLAKDKTLNDAGKALKLFQAREAITAALMATPEGQALLLDVKAQEATTTLFQAIEAEVDAEIGVGTPDVFVTKLDQLVGI